MTAQTPKTIDITADPSRVRTGPRNLHDFGKLVDELIAVGVLTRRANGRIDMPDVYRIAFQIGRRGGVPRLKSS